MAKPILYYTIFSPPARCVLMTARAIGLNMELRNVQLFKGEQYRPEYLKLNPQHSVPTLVDGDFTLWDSHAVATYLIQKYAKDDKLYPKDLKIRAKIDQRLHFEGSCLFPPSSSTLLDYTIHGLKEIRPENKQKIIDSYKLLEIFLENGNYMVGNSLTVADLSIGAMVSTLHVMFPISKEEYPKLVAYLERLYELPYFKEINGKGIEVILRVLGPILSQAKL